MVVVAVKSGVSREGSVRTDFPAGLATLLIAIAARAARCILNTVES